MVKITLYGGVAEVGGNKVLVESGDDRVFLDFGTSMGYESDFFADFLDVRTNTELKDKLTIGALPGISGIYRKDLIRPENIALLDTIQDPRILDKSSPYLSLNGIETYDEYAARMKKPFVNAVLVSHAHLDHTGAIEYLDYGIDMYCSETTRKLVEAIDDVSTFKSKALDSHEKTLGQNAKGMFPGSPRLEKSNKSRTLRRKCHTLTDEQVVTLSGTKDLKIKHISQDHSVPGASSYVLEAGGKRILYTGDIRFHGKFPLTIDEYVQKVGEGIDIMICEGTRVGSTRILTEEDVKRKIEEQIKSSKGLVFVDFGWKDTTRYETVRDAAESAGRIFVINARLAYILNKLGISYNTNAVKVFLKRKGSGLYSPDDYKGQKHEYGLSTNWDAEIDDTHYKSGLTAEDLLKDPKKYVVMLSYYDLGQIFDLANSDGKIPDSKFIRAQCSPFSDDMELDEERFINWLDAFGIEYTLDKPRVPEGCTKHDCEKIRDRMDRSHTSGHASRPELAELIKKIHPKVLIPVHTGEPEEFRKIVDEEKLDVEVKLPEKGVTLTF